MSTQVTELARRAVACRGWRWMPGMLVVGSVRYGEWPWRVCDLSSVNLMGDPGALPDLTDPATVGCLVALVREVRNEPTGFASVVTPEPSVRWAWVNGRNVAQQFFVAPDELEAIIRALENAA